MDNDNVVKVADLGVARFQNQGGVMTAETGTYRWMALGARANTFNTPGVVEHCHFLKEVESVNETVVFETENEVGPFKRQSFKRSKLVFCLQILAMACSYAPLSDSAIISSSISLRKTHSLPGTLAKDVKDLVMVIQKPDSFDERGDASAWLRACSRWRGPRRGCKAMTTRGRPRFCLVRALGDQGGAVGRRSGGSMHDSRVMTGMARFRQGDVLRVLVARRAGAAGL
ncbi:uncharacterized protein A4U43_C08F28350 [Asparagus officinalis]|nr:uncharacterized protein A4U43_C08F28350 [Asparagus officinalis]